MVVDFEKVLTTLNGDPITDGSKPINLRFVTVEALCSEFEDKASGEEKLRRWKLVQRISDGGECELSAEDVSLIKTLIGRRWPVLISGQSWEYLEGAPQRPITTREREQRESSTPN